MIRGRLLLVVLLAAACGEAKHESGPAPREPLATTQVGLGPGWQELFVAVVDDRADASDLRATMARSFDQMDEFDRQHLCPPPFDPAAFHPVNRSVVVVHPSASDDERYTSALDVPALSWRSNQRTDAEHAAWSAAVAAALEPRSTAPGPFAALDSVQQALTLLSGEREPANDAESAILTLVPGGNDGFSGVEIALAHDDESDGDPASYAATLASNEILDATILPAGTPPQTPGFCFDGSDNDTARYAAWREAQGRLYEVGHWPCSDETFFPSLEASCVDRCLDFTPVVDDDGSAHCSITAALYEDDACDAAFGWLDPVGPDGTRAPKYETVDGKKRRVCEIQQLTGAALASCVTTLDCEDCEPGWCATRVPELLECREGNPFPFRFVGGADAAAWALGRISCEKAR